MPEGRQLFPEHTVEENLELGAYRRLSNGEGARFEAALVEAMQLFPRLTEWLRQPAGLLSGGEQQMVAIARALVAGPKLLVLDEPSLGLDPPGRCMTLCILWEFVRTDIEGMKISGFCQRGEGQGLAVQEPTAIEL